MFEKRTGNVARNGHTSEVIAFSSKHDAYETYRRTYDYVPYEPVVSEDSGDE